MTTLRIQKFETASLKQVTELANQNVESGEKRTKVEEATASKRLTYCREKEGLVYWKKNSTNPDNDEIKRTILENQHTSVVAGLFRIDKRVELVQRNFYRPNMVHWITNYVRSYNNCPYIKSTRHKKFGLRQPLERPHTP